MSQNMMLENYVTTNLIFVKESFQSSNDMFEAVYKKALALGYVKENFLERIKEREKNFPTGLQLEGFGVAIPHTDAECIIKEFVAVVTTESVSFITMEDWNQQVDVNIAFILGLNEPHAQLEMLQSLMGLLQNSAILSQMIAADSADDIVTIVKDNKL